MSGSAATIAKGFAPLRALAPEPSMVFDHEHALHVV
jgi:hypothetical protein